MDKTLLILMAVPIPTHEGAILMAKRSRPPAQDIPGHDRRSTTRRILKATQKRAAPVRRPGPGQKRYGADADWVY